MMCLGAFEGMVLLKSIGSVQMNTMIMSLTQHTLSKKSACLLYGFVDSIDFAVIFTCSGDINDTVK